MWEISRPSVGNKPLFSLKSGAAMASQTADSVADVLYEAWAQIVTLIYHVCHAENTLQTIT